jgi:hypothetical protein
MNVPSDPEILRLQGRVASSPSDLQLRFDLGEALCRRKDYISAIPELQKAMAYPQLRRRAAELLAAAFDAKQMHDVANDMRRLVSGEDPDGGGSAPIPVPATPRPPTRPDISAAKEIPRNDDKA